MASNLSVESNGKQISDLLLWEWVDYRAILESASAWCQHYLNEFFILIDAQ